MPNVPFNVDAHRKWLKTEIATREASILSGRCKDFSEYQKLVGERRGYVNALDNINTVLRQDGDDDDK